jgi:hypothetical protein
MPALRAVRSALAEPPDRRGFDNPQPSQCGRDRRALFLDLVVNLPEAQSALAGFRRQLAVILARELQRQFADGLLERPVAEDGFDRRPLQPGRLAGNKDEVGPGARARQSAAAAYRRRVLLRRTARALRDK